MDAHDSGRDPGAGRASGRIRAGARVSVRRQPGSSASSAARRTRPPQGVYLRPGNPRQRAPALVCRARLAHAQPKVAVVGDGDRLAGLRRLRHGGGERTAMHPQDRGVHDDDYAYARLAANRYPALPVYLQVGNPAPAMAPEGPVGENVDIDDLMRGFRWLVGKVTADRWFAATVLPQLHVLAWGSRRGV